MWSARSEAVGTRAIPTEARDEVGRGIGHGAEDLQLRLRPAVQHVEAAARASRQGMGPGLKGLAQLIASQCRALVDAGSVIVLMGRGAEISLSAFAGQGPRAAPPSIDRDRFQLVCSRRLSAPSGELDGWLAALGLSAESLLLIPISTGDGLSGVLAACDKVGGHPGFTVEDEWLLQTFASFAGLALETCGAGAAVVRGPHPGTDDALEEERGRWAQELHDETLQNLALIHQLLAASAGAADPQAREMVLTAAEKIRTEIRSLRHLITELRPAALDRHGLVPAVRLLAAEARALNGLDIEVQVGGVDHDGTLPGLASSEIELVAYRVVQEALRNAVKHAGARTVEVGIDEVGTQLVITVRDDGHGFVAHGQGAGLGLVGMQERTARVGGSWSLATGSSGTEIRVVLPSEASARA